MPDNIVVSYGWLRQRIKVEGCGTVPKILLVEDNQAAVVKIRQFIENIDTALELLTCKEAGAAYILAQKQKVDLFILDIQLKDYKGTSLAAQLRGLPEYKYTPIIFESALAGEELSAYREVKCYGFLIKPYTEAEFRAVLCDALGLSAHLHQEEKHIQIEQKQFILDYPVSEIVYVEALGKKLAIHTRNALSGMKEDVISGYTLIRFLQLIDDPKVVQCHKSILVNTAYIDRIDKAGKEIILKGSAERLPVGNKYQSALW